MDCNATRYLVRLIFLNKHCILYPIPVLQEITYAPPGIAPVDFGTYVRRIRYQHNVLGDGL